MTIERDDSSAVPEVMKTVQSIPEITEGMHVCLQKIDPETGADIPQPVLLNGALSSGKPGRDATIRVGHRVYVDTSSNRIANSTSTVSRIDQMSDGTYRIVTAASTYRIIVLPNSQTKRIEPTTAPNLEPTRRSLSQIFSWLKGLGG